MTDQERQKQIEAAAQVLLERGLMAIPDGAKAVAREILSAAELAAPEEEASLSDPYSYVMLTISDALSLVMSGEHAGKMNELEHRNLEQLAMRVADLDPEAAREAFSDDAGKETT